MAWAKGQRTVSIADPLRSALTDPQLGLKLEDFTSLVSDGFYRGGAASTTPMAFATCDLRFRPSGPPLFMGL